MNIKKNDNVITSYTYDENGNEVKEVNGSTVIEKSYYINNQMNSLHVKENNKLTFIQSNEYNYNEQRTRKSVCPINESGSGTEKYTNYYYSNGDVLYTEGNEKGYKGFETANILNLAGNVISTVRENESDPFDENIYFYSYNKDIRNSTSSVVDDNNSGIVAYEYDDFGNTEIVGDTNFNNEICYTGGIYDKEIGEYYLNARHYDPETARFTTLDTYRGKDEKDEEDISYWHLYAYCDNNPINFADPSGHKKQKIWADRKRWTLIKKSKDTIQFIEAMNCLTVGYIANKITKVIGWAMTAYNLAKAAKAKAPKGSTKFYIRRNRWGHKGHFGCETVVAWARSVNNKRASDNYYWSRTNWGCKYTK